MTEIIGKPELSQISAASLAYLGDSVLEIFVRERLVLRGVKTPSVESLKYVTAPAQSEAVEKILPQLTEEESDVYRRGRNCVHSGVPKNATPAQYRRATGLETLFGYLYLSGENDRLRELFAVGYGE
ncbi:MAG: ribonuclease III [Clostridiales bacterium]|nr:ribonuclease III [Clostridiales bacterium]